MGLLTFNPIGGIQQVVNNYNNVLYNSAQQFINQNFSQTLSSITQGVSNATAGIIRGLPFSISSNIPTLGSGLNIVSGPMPFNGPFGNGPTGSQGYLDPKWKLVNSYASMDNFGNEVFPAEQHDTADDFGNLNQPKLKFLFTIQFIDRDLNLPAESLGNIDMAKIAFGVKFATRPNPKIEYDDANYYNYRTKVAKRMTYGTVNVVLYDDVTNRAHNIFRKYLEYISPISRSTIQQAGALQTRGIGNSSSIGSLINPYGPLRALRVAQWFYDGSYVTYDYLNPKISDFTPDELDMSQSAVNTISMTFLYDSVNISYSTDPPLPRGVVTVAPLQVISNASPPPASSTSVTTNGNSGPATAVPASPASITPLSSGGNVNIGSNVSIGGNVNIGAAAVGSSVPFP